MTLLLSISAALFVQATPLAPALAPSPAVTAAASKWPSREADFIVRDFRWTHTWARFWKADLDVLARTEEVVQ
jgi:hypothetical protein